MKKRPRGILIAFTIWAYFYVWTRSVVRCDYWRLPRCYRGERLPRKPNCGNTEVAEYCTKETVVVEYQADLTVKLPWLPIISPRLPWTLNTKKTLTMAPRGCRLLYKENHGGRLPSKTNGRFAVIADNREIILCAKNHYRRQPWIFRGGLRRVAMTVNLHGRFPFPI